MRNIIDRNYDRAEDILRTNMDKLHLMADALMKYETIDVSQIDAIMEGRVPDPPKGWSDDGNSGSGPQGGSAVPVDRQEDDGQDKVVGDGPSEPDPDPAS